MYLLQSSANRSLFNKNKVSHYSLKWPIIAGIDKSVNIGSYPWGGGDFRIPLGAEKPKGRCL